MAGRTRPTVAFHIVHVDDLRADGASNYTRIQGKHGGRRWNVVHAPVRKARSGVEGYHDKTRRTGWDVGPG